MAGGEIQLCVSMADGVIELCVWGSGELRAGSSPEHARHGALSSTRTKKRGEDQEWRRRPRRHDDLHGLFMKQPPRQTTYERARKGKADYRHIKFVDEAIAAPLEISKKHSSSRELVLDSASRLFHPATRRASLPHPTNQANKQRLHVPRLEIYSMVSRSPTQYGRGRHTSQEDMADAAHVERKATGEERRGAAILSTTLTLILAAAASSFARLHMALGRPLPRFGGRERELLQNPWIPSMPMPARQLPPAAYYWTPQSSTSTIPSEREKKPWLPPPSSWLPSLEYYVQVELGRPSFAVLLEPLNETRSGGLGEIDVFDLNLTAGPTTDSRWVGYVRGFTVETSYVPGAGGSGGARASRNVEVEVVSYDSGDGLNGTISLQGLILKAPNEVAIVGGTGCFRGARGYALVDLYSNSSFPSLVYHHSLFFL